MATSTSTLGRRRSAAQRHAVEEITREIRATDPHVRRKYLREFSSAFQSYDTALSPDDLSNAYREADILLIGDYHALASSQRFAASIVEHLASSGREVVLAVEFIFACDQHILDEWISGEIDGHELRERIRFDLDWGYDWAPFYHLLQTGRRFATAVYGFDCTPRNNLRRIQLRDRHAALKIDEIRKRHPGAQVIALIGECHLAPSHLPLLVRNLRPQDHVVTLLQNVDALYWRSVGEPKQPVQAVQVARDVVCAFNSTPLEKYESYRLAIERWRQQGSGTPDLSPAIYHMISGLLHLLNIDEYSPSTGSHAGLLVDRLPEVRTRISDAQVRSMLARKGAPEQEVRGALSRLEQNGACYLPRVNTILVNSFVLPSVAEEVSRFLHQACAGVSFGSVPAAAITAEDLFYRRVFQEALAYFGSRALYPSREPVRELDLYALYSESARSPERNLFSYADYMRMVDFLVLHKDYEANCRYYQLRPELLIEGVNWAGERFDLATRWLGRLLGSQLYDTYVSGRVTRRFIRALFVRDFRKPGSARIAYFITAKRTRALRRNRRA